MNPSTAGHHGTAHAKGCSHLRLGDFGKLFPKLPPRKLSEEEARLLGGAGGIMHDRDDASPDGDLPAGYTFLSQLVDHDITLDTGSKLHGPTLDRKGLDGIGNLRSASLDLDCVYGFGPDASPFLYENDSPGFLLTGNDVNPDDLPRNRDGRALIGDPRNDENLFVSQLQLAFLRFHDRRMIGRDFEAAQRDTRYHYQYLVWNDFLKRVTDPKVYALATEGLKKKTKKYPLVYGPDAHGRLVMPVEFSGAAYRFGHSLVRSTYPVNPDHPVVELFAEEFGTLGFSAIPPALTVDWRFLLPIDACHPYVRGKAFDHFLADELIRLPDPVVGRRASADDRSLAFRNLLRGNVYGLASGQAVAAELEKAGYPLDPAFDLEFGEIPGWKDLPTKLRKGFEEATPLFFYVMREAGVKGAKRLGRVGSAILLEVFGGMLAHCGTSYAKSDPGWEPDPCVAVSGPGEYGLADFVRYANAR